MSVFSNNLLLGAGGQSTGPAPFDPTLIGNSVWLDGSADYLSKTPGSTGNQKRFTFAFWIQRHKFTEVAPAIYSAGDGTQNNDFNIYWNNSGGGGQAGDTLCVSQINGGGVGWRIFTSQLFRDIGWYHFIISIDTAESIASDRVKIYLNGDEITSFASASYPSLNADVDYVNDSANQQRIGRNQGSNYINGSLSQYLFLDGNSIQNGDVAVTDFLDAFTYGTNGSQFSPKSNADIAALATTAGGNSFCLDFANSSDLGNDISSNNNDFTPTSMTAANQSVNTPSKVYAAWNPLRNYASGPVTLSEGNLTISGGNGPVLSTKAIPNTGKWVVTAEVSQGDFTLGVATESVGPSKLGTDAKGFCMVDTTVSFLSRTNNSDTNSTSASSAGNKVIAAFDADTGKLWLGRDTGSGYTYLGGGNPATGATPTFTISSTETLYFAAGSAGGTFACDFGQNDFDGTVPSDFQSLNSTTLTAPDYQGIDYFAPTLYEGNGTGQRVGDFVPFTDAFNVANSAMFDSSDLRYLARTPSSGGNEKTLTFSTWIKITGTGNSNENAVLTTDDGSKEAQIRITGGTLATKKVQVNLYNGSSFVLNIDTDRTFGDTSSWNHLVVAYDTRAAVASADKVIIYINGVRQSVSGTLLTVNDYDTEFNSTNAHNIGRQTNNGIGEPDFYLAETVMIDGQQLDASSFGQLDTATNRWVPKDVSGLTFGTNGFYLQYGSTFASGSGAGTDTSGNSNNWTESTDGGSAWSTSDQFTDTPSNNVFTFATDGTGTISEGNTRVDLNNSVYGLRPAIVNFPSTGKFYGEFLVNAVSGSTVGIGYARDIDSQDTTNPSTTPNNDNRNFLLQLSDGNKINGDSTGVSYGSGITAGQTAMWAFDAATGKIWFGSEGTFFASGDPAAGTNEAFILPNTGTVTLVAYDGSNARTANLTMRNATAAFEHTAPTGFTPFTQDNLDDTASKITALAWIKNRDTTDNHMLFDRVRGVGNDLHSNDTAAEVFNANTVQRFLQRGVQIGSDVEVNTANESYVLWQWLLGDSATTGSTNADGSVNTTVIAADAGHLAIAKYTGVAGTTSTVGHGLGAEPDLVIIKNRSAGSSNFITFGNEVIGIPSGNSNGNYLLLNTTKGVGAGFGSNPTTITSTTVGLFVQSQAYHNFSGDDFIMWSFKSVPGVCKVGSYIGNGNADGPYIDLGFKPAFFLQKKTSGTADWYIHDSKRNSFNVVDKHLRPSTSAIESTFTAMDFLSNGVKIRTSNGDFNTSTGTYLYLAMSDIGGNGTLPPVYGR